MLLFFYCKNNTINIHTQCRIEEKVKLFYDNGLSIQPIIGFVLYVLLLLKKACVNTHNFSNIS